MIDVKLNGRGFYWEFFLLRLVTKQDEKFQYNHGGNNGKP